MEQQQVEQNNTKQDKKPEQKRESKYVFDKSLLTIETPIPQVPKQKERLAKPDEDAMKKKQDQIQKKIEDIYHKKRNFYESLIQQNNEHKETNNSGTQSIRENMKSKIEENKEKQAQFQEIKAKFDAVKQKLDSFTAQVNDIKQKLKTNYSLEQMEDMLEEKQNLLHNGTLSAAQEKRLFQEVDNLKKALPMLESIEPLQDQIEELRAEKAEIKKVYVPLLEELNKGRDIVRENKEQLDEIKLLARQAQEKMDPIVQEKKSEFQVEIDELREEKKKLFQEFKAQQREYYEEQDLIRYAEWAKRHVDRLKRDEQRKKREQEKEERLKQEQDEEDAIKKIVVNPYLQDIATCEQLLAFCQNYKQQHQDRESKERKQQQDQEIQLDSQLLEKQGLTLIASKKTQDDNFLAGTKGKKGKKRPQKKQNQEQQQVQSINFGITEINDFATVKITPPKDINDIEKTIQLLQEKKSYLEGLPLPESNPEEQKQDKPERRTAVVDNEEEYPEL